MTNYPYSATQLGVRPAPELVQKLLAGSFGWMFAGLLLSAGVAFLTGSSEAMLAFAARLWLPILIGQLILGFVLQLAINRVSATVALGMFFVYAASMGLTLGLIVWMVLQQAGGSGTVATAFLSASGMFGAAAVYGRVTSRDLSGLGGILFMGVIGILIASGVNLFLNSGPLSWVISIVGVVIFTALTAYDVQRIVRGDYAAWTGSLEKASILAAFHLYINFINLFLFMLRILGGSRR